MKNKKGLLKVFFIFILNISFALSSSSSNVYDLTTGKYTPIEVEIYGAKIHKLIGVPFTNNIPKAFKTSSEQAHPVSTSDSFVKQATNYSDVCVQPVIFYHNFYGNFKLPHEYQISFDCLSLNIYIPKNNLTNLTAMIFIHGGSNAAGTGSFLDGTALASIGNVIVVMLNYRLDVLGFFNFPSPNYKGNYGLWDQFYAIKWLHANCEHLGCNKNSITVFGHSAGASDTMLLSLSKVAKPYINRIIMQSGSALAHWSFLHEIHLIEEIKKLNERTTLDISKVLERVDFKSLNYIQAFNKTFKNFLSTSTCSLTRKYECLKMKLEQFYNVYFDDLKSNFESSGNMTTNEKFVITSLKSIFEKLDLNEINSFFGFVHSHLLKVLKDHEFHLILRPYSLFQDSKQNTSRNTTRNPSFEALLRRNNNNKASKNQDQKYYDVECYSELSSSINQNEHLILVCEYLNGILNRTITSDFLNSKIISHFLSCFRDYYEKRETKANELSEINIVESLLPHNSALILNEIESCINQGIELTKNKQDNQKLQSILKDLSLLTTNPSYLHRACVDGHFIDELPHYNSLLSDEIDTLVGITSQESFYFLLHEYHINEILIHTFIYSSTLNLTDNLVFKLAQINDNESMAKCLRQNLLSYYNIVESGDLNEKNDDTIINDTRKLDLLSDFDFLLPLISQLKSYYNKEHQQLGTKATNKKVYAYFYSYLSSIRYLLDYLTEFNDAYMNAFKQMNSSAVPHFSELDYVFGLPILSKLNLIKYKDNVKYLYNYTQEDYKISLQLMKYWSNFAKYGNPSFTYEAGEDIWSSFSAENPSIFMINSTKPKSDNKIIQTWLAKHKFWYEELPNRIFDECLSEFGPLTNMSIQQQAEMFYLSLKTNNSNSKCEISFLSIHLVYYSFILYFIRL